MSIFDQVVVSPFLLLFYSYSRESTRTVGSTKRHSNAVVAHLQKDIHMYDPYKSPEALIQLKPFSKSQREEGITNLRVFCGAVRGQLVYALSIWGNEPHTWLM